MWRKNSSCCGCYCYDKTKKKCTRTGNGGKNKGKLEVCWMESTEGEY